MNVSGNGLLKSEFDYSLFLSRYMCGGVALTESRTVSRQRLELVKLGVAEHDIAAVKLHEDIVRYRKAITDFSTANEITVELLCKANGRFSQRGKPFGKIRKTQNWVGKSIENASYLPPEPQKLDSLLRSLCSMANEPITLNSAEYITYLYGQLIMIHPFCEGNGRTSRAIVEATLLDSSIPPINFSLYRVGLEPSIYRNSFWNLNTNYEDISFSSYWNDAYDWCKTYYEEAEKTLEAARRNIINKTALLPLSADTIRVMNGFWQSPLLTPKYIQQQFNWSHDRLYKAINCLIQIGLIKVFKLKLDSSNPVFVCEELSNAWKQLDDLVFSNKKLEIKQ